MHGSYFRKHCSQWASFSSSTGAHPCWIFLHWAASALHEDRSTSVPSVLGVVLSESDPHPVSSIGVPVRKSTAINKLNKCRMVILRTVTVIVVQNAAWFLKLNFEGTVAAFGLCPIYWCFAGEI